MSRFPFILSLALTAGALLPGAAGAEVTFAADNLNMSGNQINNLGMAPSPADGDAANVGFVNTGLASKADTGHNHDGRYYTQTQVDALITAATNTATALEARIDALENNNTNLQTRLTTLETNNSDLQTHLSALETLLEHFTRNGNQIYITGANLHVRSGAGQTDAEPNGLGNVIIGYDEARSSGNSSCSLGEYDNETDCTNHNGTWALNHKSGSHNLVVGIYNNYSRYGGLVAGYWNTISGVYSAVSGGYRNTASGNYSAVSGGRSNTASGFASAVSGGIGNSASGGSSAVSGGWRNTASGSSSAVSGGYGNTASGYYSAVSGGFQRSVTGQYDWAAGSLSEDF